MISFVVSKNLTKIWHRSKLASRRSASDRQAPKARERGCKATGWPGQEQAGSRGAGVLPQHTTGGGVTRAESAGGARVPAESRQGAGRGIVKREFKGEKVNEMRTR